MRPRGAPQLFKHNYNHVLSTLSFVRFPLNHMALLSQANAKHNTCYFPKVNESIPLITLLVKHLTRNKMP